MSTGEALALARWERGGRLVEHEHHALRHNSMWGSDGYPVHRLGRGWIIDSPAATGFGIMRTKREAVERWENLIECWGRLSGLEAQERALLAREDRS